MKKIIMITLLALCGQMILAQNADTTLFIQEDGLIKKIHQTKTVISTWENQDNGDFSEANLRELEESYETEILGQEGRVPIDLWPVKIQKMAITTSYHLHSDGTIFELTKKPTTTQSASHNGYVAIFWLLIPFLLALALGFSTYDTRDLLIVYGYNLAMMGLILAAAWLFLGSGGALSYFSILCLTTCTVLALFLFSMYLNNDGWVFNLLAALFVLFINLFFIPYSHNLNVLGLSKAILGQYILFYLGICIFSLAINVLANYGKSIKKYLRRKSRMA